MPASGVKLSEKEIKQQQLSAKLILAGTKALLLKMPFSDCNGLYFVDSRLTFTPRAWTSQPGSSRIRYSSECKCEIGSSSNVLERQLFVIITVAPFQSPRLVSYSCKSIAMEISQD
jgi:hypothetical protein